MSRPYWQPKYKREEAAAKSNPSPRRGGKKKDKDATTKILLDRYYAAEVDLIKYTLWHKRDLEREQNCEWKSTGHKRGAFSCFHRMWSLELMEDRRKRMSEIEAELKRRGKKIPGTRLK